MSKQMWIRSPGELNDLSRESGPARGFSPLLRRRCEKYIVATNGKNYPSLTIVLSFAFQMVIKVPGNKGSWC